MRFVCFAVLTAITLGAQTPADEVLAKLPGAYSNLTAIRIAAVREDEVAAAGDSQVTNSECDLALRGSGPVRVFMKQSGVKPCACALAPKLTKCGSIRTGDSFSGPRKPAA
jgi:hypothetical protein